LTIFFSRLREKDSNPHLLVQSQAACPWPIPESRIASLSSCNGQRTTDNGPPSCGGRSRTYIVLLNREAPYRSATPHQLSAQRESNPRFRHGKAAGYRYIMGAKTHYRIVKEHPVGSEGLEPSPAWLRARHAAANTLIPHSSTSSNRAGGIRTHANRIKSPECCRYTTTPQIGRVSSFQSLPHRKHRFLAS
jgi:hypothetical protein